MTIADLITRIIFLLIPGMIWIYIEEKLVYRRIKTNRQYIVEVIIKSFLSYLILLIIYNTIDKICNCNTIDLYIFKSIFNGERLIKMELLYASIISIIFSIINSYLTNKQIGYKIFRVLGIISKKGKSWNNILINEDGDVCLTIKDNMAKVIYEGKVVDFSIQDSFPEIVLKNVKEFTFNDRTIPIKTMDYLYIKIDENYTVEVESK